MALQLNVTWERTGLEEQFSAPAAIRRYTGIPRMMGRDGELGLGGVGGSY